MTLLLASSKTLWTKVLYPKIGLLYFRLDAEFSPEAKPRRRGNSKNLVSVERPHDSERVGQMINLEAVEVHDNGGSQSDITEEQKQNTSSEHNVFN